MSKITIKNLSKHFKETRALSGVNFESEEDEFVVIVGPSGCGKTTLLRIIAGLEKCSTGELLIDGVNIINELPQNRDIAMVFQSYALYPNLSVYDNLAFPLLMRNKKKSEIATAVTAIAEKLELSNLLNRKPGTLSGGQRQRVAIGRAMIRNPKVFLLDEPLSNLDAALREKMRGELISLHKSLNAIFFYVTHDQTEAMAMGDRIIVLNEGIVQQMDTPEQIYNHPSNAFVAGFIGTPRMNFINYNTYLSLGGKNLDMDLNELTIGIRPEDVVITKVTGNESQQESISYGEILFLEVLGKEIHYHVKYGDETIIVCVTSSTADVSFSSGDLAICKLNPMKVHFFSKKNEGKRISLN